MAAFQVYVEDGFEDLTVAYVLALPGCFSVGKTAVAALAAVPRALRDYSAWLGSHGETSQAPSDLSFEVVEQQRCPKVGGIEVGVLFDPETQPISLGEAARAAHLLGYSRSDLLDLVGELDDAALDWRSDEAAPSVRRLLMQLARAEIFYYILFNETSPAPLPDWMTRRQSALEPGAEDPRPFLAEVRAALLAWLRRLTPEQRAQQTEDRGERWSARKLVRRALYNERRRSEQVRDVIAAYRRGE